MGDGSLTLGGVAELTVSVDHGQFIVSDTDAELDIESYSDDAMAAGLATWSGGFAVFTDSHWASCAVRLALVEARPEPNLTDCDHAVEGVVELRSGRVAVFGPEGTGIDEAVVVIPPGSYGVLVLGYEFGTANEHGEDGDDNYTILFWPGTLPATRVLKAGGPGA